MVSLVICNIHMIYNGAEYHWVQSCVKMCQSDPLHYLKKSTICFLVVY